jgi:hypothetical protein
MTAVQKIAGGIAIAMVATALFLPGRSSQENAVLGNITKLTTGSIQAAEGR